MRQQYQFVCVLFLSFICVCKTQNSSTTTPSYPDFNGDPRICTVNPLTTLSPTTTQSPSPPPLPQFPNQAEFRLERVIIRHRLDAANSSELTLYHYFYDYDQNQLVVLENENGTYDAEFYDYNQLKRVTYEFEEYTCNADVIVTDYDLNGRSATQLENGTWHIRPLNEFLLFSSNALGREVIPIYLGQEVIRGIPVNTWESCYVNRPRRRTVRRVWSFAQPGVAMPSGIVGDIAVPVQAIINASTVDESDVQTLEYDEVFNILSYRPSLTQSAMSIPQPRGIYCDNVTQEQLVSLKDVGISWPYRFNVRIDASTSEGTQWQSFHLYYHQGDDAVSGRLRYDYLPANGDDYESVIHDYTDNLTYIIDRRLGTCQINRGVEIPDVDPIRDPIQFFIKNEALFIVTPPENVWEDRGARRCRMNSIPCKILTTSFKNFPPIIEPDTGKPSGETWATTYIEYAWSMRAPDAPPRRNETKPYDYPVSLFLRMLRDENSPPESIETVNVEYEFYEVSHDGNLNQFDVSTCYRSKGYEYLHLVFVLNLNRGDIADSEQLNRRRLDQDVHYNLINRMQIRYSRITDLEIDHEQVSNDLTVFFTILGQTPDPDSPSGFVVDEATAAQAHDIIKQVIDDGEFEFEMQLQNQSVVQFRAQPGSLVSSKQYMSTHSRGKKDVDETYTLGSQVTAALVGALIGLFVGVVLAAVLRIVKKKPMPSLPSSSSIANPVSAIYVKPGQTTTTAATTTTSDA